MAHLNLAGVGIEFPIYHASARSMRRIVIQGAIGRKLDLSGSRATVRALSEIDLEVSDGDRLALIGPNGAGKSTLLRTMAGVYPPRTGIVRRSGRITGLLSLGMGLNPEVSGRENILLLGMHQNIPPRDMLAHVDEIIAWTELGSFINAPLRTYSAGMTMRLIFATITARPPEILLMDEWFGIGDADFQIKAYERMAAFVSGSSLVVLASHSTTLLRQWCTRAVRLDGGRIVERGTTAALLPASEPAVPGGIA
jgi:ABC-2 type transport system ATP-binding protein/lipopolysaccharide transport system ATP-binding protein